MYFFLFSEINECVSNPCINGDCVDGINLYACNCNEGWTGYNCDVYEGCSSNPSQNGGTCMQGEDTFDCVCAYRFAGTFCEISKYDLYF